MLTVFRGLDVRIHGVVAAPYYVRCEVFLETPDEPGFNRVCKHGLRRGATSKSLYCSGGAALTSGARCGTESQTRARRGHA